jgi:hypothetical protein
MLDKLTRDQFAGYLRQSFRLRSETSAFDLELIEVRNLAGPLSPSGREPFALLFRGPAEPILPQRIYPLEHAGLGKLDVFLVPVGPDDQGMRYEAVFN